MNTKSKTDLLEKLKKYALKAVTKEENYSREEVIWFIQLSTHVSLERAQDGFRLMVEYGVLKNTGADRFYLADSTPF